VKRSPHFVWLWVPACLALTTATPLAQGQQAPAKQPAAKQAAVAPAASVVPTTNVRPVKGTAVINVLKPVVKVQGSEVVTTIQVKNMSYGSIAGLRVDEYWYDKGGNVVTGDSKRWMKPVMPQEVVTIELRTPKNPKMDRNSYQFSHANGKVQAETVKKF
jgi:hypothetical protein